MCDIISLMPSKKIISILIICIAIISSVWIISKRYPGAVSATTTNIGVTTYNYRSDVGSGDNWKNLLANINSNPVTYTDIVDKGDTFDETTVTGQIAMDFMSKYILLKQDGEVTKEEMSQIIASTLASDAYTEGKKVQYVEGNLNIIKKDDRATLQAYMNEVNTSIKTGLQQIKVDPQVVLFTAMRDENEEELAKLDPMIRANREIIAKFLEMQVPYKATSLHLALLNAFGNTLSNLEAIRGMFNDPIRGYIGFNYYNKSVLDFVSSLNNLNAYLKQKLSL